MLGLPFKVVQLHELFSTHVWKRIKKQRTVVTSVLLAGRDFLTGHKQLANSSHPGVGVATQQFAASYAIRRRVGQKDSLHS